MQDSLNEITDGMFRFYADRVAGMKQAMPGADGGTVHPVPPPERRKD